MRLGKYSQAQFNFARETEAMTDEEIDYRTKLATGMTDAERTSEFLKWKSELSNQDRIDFDKMFN
jgi:hypothetical protein